MLSTQLSIPENEVFITKFKVFHKSTITNTMTTNFENKIVKTQRRSENEIFMRSK